MVRILEKQLAQAGYKLIGMLEIEQTILSILDSKNTRFLKAIPYLIYLHQPDIKLIYSKTKEKKLLKEIITITKKIFMQASINIKLPDINEQTKLNFEEFLQEFNLQKNRSTLPNLLFEKEKF